MRIIARGNLRRFADLDGAKYITYDTPQGRMGIVFSPNELHAELARRFVREERGDRLASAGWLTIGDDDRIVPHGSSQSLNIHCAPDDEGLINAFFDANPSFLGGIAA